VGSGTPWAWTACCAGYCPRTAAASEWSGCSSGWSPRAIAPASKLATAAWLTRRTHIPGLTDQTSNDVDGRAGVGDDECYRARDWLIQAAPQVAREVFWSLASLLDLEVTCCSSTPAAPTSRSTTPTRRCPESNGAIRGPTAAPPSTK